MAKITFTNTSGFKELNPPQPASKYIPNWYKEMQSYVLGEKKPAGDGTTTATIKRCMPVFDAITAGYIISLPADIFVTQKEGGPWFEWANFNLVSFHMVEQAPNHPARNGMPEYPKIMNPWSIQTPKGYSTLFVEPMHRDNLISILPGVVDTDVYTPQVNFPFVLKDPKFEGLIPEGTPIAQVIPFKRESWEIKIGNENNLKHLTQVVYRVNLNFFDKYKNRFWHKKEYK